MEKIIEISPKIEKININSENSSKPSKHKPSIRKNTFIFTMLVKDLFSSTDSILLSLLIMTNIILIVYEFSLGFLLKSLHLLSDSIHGIIHIGSFTFALIAFYISRKAANLNYTYGYSRIETLSAFINAFFLVFLAAFAFMGRIHHIIEHYGHHFSEKNNDIFFIDVLKTGFNVIGAICFCRYASLKNSSKHEIPRNHSHLQNFHTIFLHFFLDALFNFSNVVLYYYEVFFQYGMDIAFSAIVLFLTILLCKRVLIHNGILLLQGFPIKDEEFISSVLREISVVEGVLNIKEKKFWGMHSGYLVCSLKIVMRVDANREESLKDIHEILKPKFNNICVEFIYEQ